MKRLEWNGTEFTDGISRMSPEQFSDFIYTELEMRPHLNASELDILVNLIIDTANNPPKSMSGNMLKWIHDIGKKILIAQDNKENYKLPEWRKIL